MVKLIKKVMSIGLLFFSVSLLEASPRNIASSGHASLRSINDIFPGLGANQIGEAFSAAGLRNTFLQHETPLLAPAPGSGIDILSIVMGKNPSQLIEALIVIPYGGRRLTKLDAYNAIGRIENISRQTIFSRPRDAHVQVFEESTRLDGGRRSRPIPDPPPATILPSSEIVYIRLRDTSFGNTFFRGTLTTSPHGITYYLTNNAAIWFLMFPVMRAERFSAILYVEPVAEGMLVYSVAGITVPDFIANRINIAANIDRRVTIFLNWLTEGLGAVR